MSALKILLAEDNRGDVILVKHALAQHRVACDIFLVRDGGEALDFVARMGEAQEAPYPDVVLLDLNLPKVDGTAVLAEFRKKSQCARTPVIVITSSDASRDRERMEALGVARYFRKPLDLDAFLQLGLVVREVMEECGLATTS
jgi:chemotaxis family two-component system response regulator Rcp1